jgi:hypothetical protein
MYCNTSLVLLPLPARLPCALVLLLILSLLWQTGSTLPLTRPAQLPPLPLVAPPGRSLRRRAHRTRRSPHSLRRGLAGQRLPCALVRSALLALLLQTSGWTLPTALGWVLRLLPLGQWFAVHLALATSPATPAAWGRRGAAALQRLYQLVLVVLLFSTFTQVLKVSAAPGGVGPLLVGGWVLQPDDATEVSVTATAAQHYAVTLRGAFRLVWEPRDSFER